MLCVEMLRRATLRLFPAAAAEEKRPMWQERLARMALRHKRIVLPSIPESEKAKPFPGLESVQPVRGSVRTGLLAYKIGHMGLYD